MWTTHCLQQRELASRGIPAHFHLARNGDWGPPLRDLTRQAAVLVTEEMPVQPLADRHHWKQAWYFRLGCFELSPQTKLEDFRWSL
jgi:hypothetical protein